MTQHLEPSEQAPTSGGWRPGRWLRTGLAIDRFLATTRHASASPPCELLRLPSAVVRVRRGGDGPGRPVLVVPDPPNVIEHYAALFPALARAGPCAVAEAPAFGFSSPTGPFGFSIRDMARTLIELLERLAFRDATLSLACVGAFGALRAAAERPDLVGRLVLSQIASHEEMAAWVRREDVLGIIQTPVIGQLALALGGRFVARRWYSAALPPGSDATSWSDPALAALRHGGGFPLASAFQVFAREPPAPIVVPQRVTVLFGSADPTHLATDHDSARCLAECVELQKNPHAGHFPDLEDPEPWLRLLRD